MTDTDRMMVWLREAMDAAELAAQRAAALCGCHPPAPHWSFRDGDEPTDGRILIVDDPHPTLKRKIGRRWNGSYEGLAMAEHVVRHDPAAVLHRIAADRKMLGDLLAEQHSVVEDPAYTCPAATMERDGGKNYQQGPCDCGLVERTERRVRLLAEGYGWTEKPDWPECMCTPSGECGNCWEKRQRTPDTRAAEGEPR